MDRRFYDIHYHLFDLSHPNLLAFLMRDDLITDKRVKRIVSKLPLFFKVFPLWVITLFSRHIAVKVKEYLKNDVGKVLNLLSVMEGAIEYHFLYTEYFLLKEKFHFGKGEGFRFNKVVLCPLIIDFGYKGTNRLDCFYNFPPAKPVVNQVIDLFNAIYFYYNYDIIIHPEKPEKFRLIPATSLKKLNFLKFTPS